jgi:thioredoxin-dependent peroxiredoxin
MNLRIGDIAPDFTAKTTLGAVQFHSWLGNSWGILFSHPRDFTPVCTTELGYVSRIYQQFENRGVKVIALSMDSVESHHEWIKDINETQSTTVQYPVIADETGEIANLYDMFEVGNPAATVRSVFFIGPDKKIKATITYPPSTGRNFQEVLRVIDSLQMTANHKLATPANWERGKECVILPDIKDEDAEKMYPGFQKIRNYLRTTPDPVK